MNDLVQRRAELSASEARKSAILKSALDAIVSMDHEGNIVEFNPAAENTFGYRAIDVIGKRLELTGMRADGTEFPVEVAITRVEPPGPPLFTFYLRDISERKGAEEELKRIASDVHDDSIQVMAAVGVRLGMLRSRLTDPDHSRWIEKLEAAVQLSIGRLRHLLFQLAPPALESEGLAAAIRTYLDEAFGEIEVEYNLESLIGAEPSREIRTLVYRIAQEALSNVRKHAQATRVEVRLEDRNGGLMVSIRDDGVGYEKEDAEARLPGHLGLVSMRERAEMLGGWFRIEGSRGAGTKVEFWLPGDARFGRESG